MLLHDGAVLSALACLLDLVASSLGLICQHLGAGLLSLLLVDELHENALVLEHVTLGLQVELVVQVAIDLLGLTITTEKATQDSHALHPEKLLGHTGITSTLPLSGSGVTTLATGFRILTDARPENK